MAHKHSIYDCDTHFSIDLKTREIKNDIGKTVIVQNDHNSERFSFELPKEIEGHDMSLCNVVQVHFVNTDSQNKEKHNGLYTVDDLQISPDGDDVVILSWLLSQEATRAVGSLYFGIVFKCIEEDGTLTYSWHTTVNKDFKVVESLDNSNIIIEEYPDILAQLEARLAAVEQGGTGSGSGLTEEQAAEIAANTEARHTHNNKSVLDNFEEKNVLGLCYFGNKVILSHDLPSPIPKQDINNYFVDRTSPISRGYVNETGVMEIIYQLQTRFATKEDINNILGGIEEIETLIDESGVLE